MKKYRTSLIGILLLYLLVMGSCGPVIISPSPHNPPPSWFYPSRIESTRYVYFPEYQIYYDLSLGMYLYFEKNAWIRVNVLPKRYRSINFKRSKYIRIKGYRGDDIQNYHRRNYSKSTQQNSGNSSEKRRN